MSCSGLHCAGCGAGVSIPPLGLAVTLGLAWVAEHLVEVAMVSATCGILSVAAVVALMRWQDRRQARFAAQASVWTARPVPLAATATPQVTRHDRPAIPQAVIFNFYGTGPMAARAFQAITGPAGDATTTKGE